MSTDELEAGFEGPEKRLEVNLRPVEGDPLGLRNLPRDFWDRCMAELHGSILDHVAGSDFDAYIITESSLFVYPFKMMVLTCGTTTLLQMTPLLLEGIREQGYEVEWFQFSRKNYTFPESQRAMHKDFASEVAFLKEHDIHGQGYAIGPLTSDHYYYFFFDNIIRPEHGNAPHEIDQQLNLYMYDISEQSSAHFTMGNQGPSALEVTHDSGIGDIFEDSTLQPHLFDPMGYSMNGLNQDGSYWTIHITPESHCSYASFETNKELPSYQELIMKNLKVFEPQRFTAIVFADEDSAFGKSFDRCQVVDKEAVWKMPGYRLLNLCFNEFEPGYYVVLANYLSIQQRALTSPTNQQFPKLPTR